MYTYSRNEDARSEDESLDTLMGTLPIVYLSHEGIVQAVENFHIVALTKGPDGEIEEFQCPRNSVSRQSQHTQDYDDYVLKPTAAPNASCIGQRIVIVGYGLVLRGKGGLVIDVIIEEGLAMVMVTLDDEPDVPQMFLPGELTIEGQGEQLDIRETSKALEQIKGHLLRNKISTVRDVICGQDSNSRLHLIIVLEMYDPAITNKESNPQLLGHELCIKVNGKAKTLIFRQGRNSSQVECYICKGKKKIEAVSAELIEAMHPATPHNYKHWIVIKGQHTGKYVHSIRYEKGATPKMPIWWTVAIVTPVEGQVDEQTGEELHLESTDLCLEKESKSSRETNMLFSQKL
ncbi:uncharacterized protein EV420DRAFT_1473279 [Desarmillaria tabescens]|uniref:Uncharacterized protein n=1 Tax=Armillaria tabescens TaxID=1929756 RepID=A0AA39NQW1_ARMTA|nr:uncharacterized protein EV420DRAFT_1473279 [Desarmillaria tabescens]KAK0470197.1 hypothetical protein EV420DRAFT_1473279 [Desarmillaria tabescens]